MSKKQQKKNNNNKDVETNIFIIALNWFLLILLVLLVGYEVVNLSYTSSEPEIKLESAIIVPEVAAKEDFAYLEEALYFDEMNEDVPVATVENWENTIAHINNINIPAEDVYGLYEEKLPDNISPGKTEQTPHFDKPVLAIVIDDMGISHKRTADISSLAYPLTSSFLTYGTLLDEQIEKARVSGHEIMAHIPMEPMVLKDVSPDVLKIMMSEAEIKANLETMLAKFSGIQGVNNHMGSRLTENKKSMDAVMKVLEDKDLFFLDSKTTAKSVAEAAAQKHNVEYAIRDVFLDNEDKFDYIIKQLNQAKQIAVAEGYAIAIGHPKAQTYNALKAWLPNLKDQGVELVHLSDIVKILNYSE